MTLMKDQRSLWARDVVLSAPEDETTITTGDVATMFPSNHTDAAVVYELAGPAQSYFEFPLDWFIDQGGHIQPADFPGAIRLIQRVHYKSFSLIGTTAEDVQRRATEVEESVKSELKARSQIGYIWWRLYPKYEIEGCSPGYPPLPPGKPARHKVRLRLGTLPALSTRFWLDLSKKVENISSEPLVPRE
jgi:hypothetical protein